MKRKARQRIELAADRMAAGLLKIATSAESESVKLRAIESALDRAGLMVPKQLDVEVGPSKPWQAIISSISGSRADYLASVSQPAPDVPEWQRQPEPDVLEAEIVEDRSALPPHFDGVARNALPPSTGTPEPPYATTGPITGDRAIEEAARANREAGVWRVRRRRA